MGAWGTSLYANDIASDIRGDYIDKLKRKKTNEEATQELIDQNWEIMGDVEEEPLFWFALADTQWNYGRLLPHVKEKALLFLSKDQELERWKESEEKFFAWKKTLEMLKKKLSSPQPPSKKVLKYRLYQCKWVLGDVFAYRFTSEYSRRKGFYGQHVIFRKVSEDTWWPGHIVPVIQIYKWIGTEFPPLEKLPNFGLLPVFYSRYELSDLVSKTLNYEIKLVNESEKSIPKENLKYLGNLFGKDCTQFRGHDFWTGYGYVGWESSKYNIKFEHFVIDTYVAWKEYLTQDNSEISEINK